MVRLVNQRWRWCGQKSFQKNKKSRTFRSALNDPSGNRTRVYGVRGRRLDRLTNGPGKIEATGFEPATSASRTQRSTKLSHASFSTVSLMFTSDSFIIALLEKKIKYFFQFFQIFCILYFICEMSTFLRGFRGIQEDLQSKRNGVK